MRLLQTVFLLFICRKETLAASPASSWTHDRVSTSMPWNELPAIDTQARLLNRSSAAVADNGAAYDLIVTGIPATATDTNTTAGNRTTAELASWLGCDNNSNNNSNRNSTLAVLQTLQQELVSASAVAGTMTDTVYVEGRRIVLLQLQGPSGSSKSSSLQAAAATVGAALAAKILQTKATRVAVVLPTAELDALPTSVADYLTEMVTALYVGLYQDERFQSSGLEDNTNDKNKNDKKRLQTLDLLVYDSSNSNSTNNLLLLKDYQAAIQKAAIVAQGVFLARDIVNAPHNVLNSVGLAATAAKLAAKYKCLTCRILTAEQCQAAGMGAFLGVARGSETPAQFIHLTYHPPKRRTRSGKKLPPLRRLGIVGKGLLFDTGGYNIKTSMMELMKFDCGGAAAVLGAARSLAQLQPAHTEVHFVVAACENMINERAVVPGDILTASNGKTIEVINTDAEGRLTMADALVYVDRTLQCDEILELSTLTGACMVSLGPSIAGLWTANDELARGLTAASDATGEKIWRMPLEEDYKEELKSKCADLKNLGGRYGGAIAAALFLQHFVDGDKPFAHVDMAGPVWNTKAGQATGWGAKLVTEWVCQKSRDASY